MEPCCKTVFYGRGNKAACYRSGRYKYEGKLYCKQHHPPEVQKRKEAQKKKRDEAWARKQHSWEVQGKRRKSLDILRKIADGCKDPHRVAIDFLKEYEDLVNAEPGDKK